MLDTALGPGTEPIRLEHLLRENLQDNHIKGLRRPVGPAAGGREQTLDAWRMVSMLPFYSTPAEVQPGPVRLCAARVGAWAGLACGGRSLGGGGSEQTECTAAAPVSAHRPADPHQAVQL